MLTELLKNSFRATVENHWHEHGTSTTLPLHPVVITLSLPSQNFKSTKETSGADVPVIKTVSAAWLYILVQLYGKVRSLSNLHWMLKNQNGSIAAILAQVPSPMLNRISTPFAQELLVKKSTVSSVHDIF